MFPRIATVERRNKAYKYLQIVEAYWGNGRTTQRIVANLGRLDQLDEKLNDLLASLSKHGKRVRLVSGGSRSARRVVSILGIADLNPRFCSTSASRLPETAM